jgi:hypothetical protein
LEATAPERTHPAPVSRCKAERARNPSQLPFATAWRKTVRITRGELFEVAFWLAFAAAAFALSFKFDQEIEIYKFGATGWPRVVIVLIVLGALGQLFNDIKARLAGSTRENNAPSPARAGVGPGYAFRITAILVAPFVFAFLLEYIGFYSLAPFFVAAFLYIGGERRWGRIVGISLFIYALMILLFAKLLFVGLPVGNWHPFYDFSNWLLVLLQ